MSNCIDTVARVSIFWLHTCSSETSSMRLKGLEHYLGERVCRGLVNKEFRRAARAAFLVESAVRLNKELYQLGGGPVSLHALPLPRQRAYFGCP
eukprot:6189434-Pleurochrysis_carterae.AAC.2